MAYVRIDLDGVLTDGQHVTFKAPCNCTNVEGLRVYYPDNNERVSKTFAMKDAHGGNLAGIGNLFAKDAYVHVILDTNSMSAYLQNAGTNTYLKDAIGEAKTLANNVATSKAPNNHASSGTTYGLGTSSNYGHVKLYDGVDSANGVSNGVAATPKAVKAAYDLANTAKSTATTASNNASTALNTANTAKTTAESALPKAGGTLTGAITFPNNVGLIGKDTNGNAFECFRFGSANQLIFGDGLLTASNYDTQVCSGNIIRLITPKARVILGHDGTTGYFWPNVASGAKCNLGGANNKWNAVYSSTATIQTSDAREKENIVPLGTSPMTYMSGRGETIDIHSELFDRLQPVQYTMVDGDGKICYGLIAQDVAVAMEEIGYDENDLDLVHHDYWVDEETGEEKDAYGLAYGNLIAMLIHEVQKLKAEVASLKETE